MKLILKSLALFFFAGISGCGTELNNYYSKIKIEETINNHIPVRFDIFTLDVPQQNSVDETITLLSEKGQAEAIKVLGTMYNNPDEFLASLAKSFEIKPKSALTVKSKFKRRIVVQVADTPIFPADRLDQATIHLKLEGAKFLSWDKFATNHETIEIGTLTSKRQFTGSVTVKATDPDPAPVAKVGEVDGQLEYSRSLEEGKKLSRQYAHATAILSETDATIILTGNENTRLTDNIIFDAEIELKNPQLVPYEFFEISSLFLKNKPISPNKVNLTSRKAERLPSIQDLPVKVTAILNYYTRHVNKGDETVIEGDDEVEIKSGETGPIHRELVPKEEGQSNLYNISLEDNGLIHVKVEDGSLLPLKFKDYSKALELKEWLKSVYGKLNKSNITIGNYQLFIGPDEKNHLSSEDVKLISVK